MAVAIMFSGIAAVALPLAQEFGITREIDDRVMCPLPIGAVAIEKIVFSAIQSIFAAAVVFPLAYYIPTTPVLAHVSSWWFLIAVLVLASLLAGALGLTIGTFVQPKQIGLIFGVVIMPITFLGCVYYPWAQLSTIRWLQIGVLINPIVYITEGLRAALTPHHRSHARRHDPRDAALLLRPADRIGPARLLEPRPQLARRPPDLLRQVLRDQVAMKASILDEDLIGPLASHHHPSQINPRHIRLQRRRIAHRASRIRIIQLHTHRLDKMEVRMVSRQREHKTGSESPSARPASTTSRRPR